MEGPFDRRKQLPSFCRKRPCSEFITMRSAGKSRYTGFEKCLGCPHKANKHVCEEIKEREKLPKPEQLRFDIPSPAVKKFGEYALEESGEPLFPFQRISVGYNQSANYVSPLKRLIRRPSPLLELERVLPQLQPGPRSPQPKHLLSSSPSGFVDVSTSPALAAPLPIEGPIRLEKFYKYFLARSDYTDQLYNRLLKQGQSSNQETTALLDGLYLDISTLHDEVKGVKKMLDQIAENHQRERPSNQPAEGCRTHLVTPARPPAPKVEDGHNEANEPQKRETLSTPPKRSLGNRMSEEWRIEFSKLERQSTLVGVGITVPSSDESNDSMWSSDSATGSVSVERTSSRKSRRGREQKRGGGDEGEDVFEVQSRGRKVRSGKKGGKEMEEEEGEGEDEEGEEEDEGESETGKSIGADREDNNERNTKGDKEEHDDEEELGDRYYGHLGRARSLLQLYSGALPMLTPIQEETYSGFSPKKKLPPMPSLRIPLLVDDAAPLEPTRKPFKPGDWKPCNRRLSFEVEGSDNEGTSEIQNDEEEQEPDVEDSSPLQAQHRSSHSLQISYSSSQDQSFYSETTSSSESISSDKDEESDIPNTKRKRDSDTPGEQNSPKRAYIEQLEDSGDKREAGNESHITSSHVVSRIVRANLNASGAIDGDEFGKGSQKIEWRGRENFPTASRPNRRRSARECTQNWSLGVRGSVDNPSTSGNEKNTPGISINKTPKRNISPRKTGNDTCRPPRYFRYVDVDIGRRQRETISPNCMDFNEDGLQHPMIGGERKPKRRRKSNVKKDRDWRSV